MALAGRIGDALRKTWAHSSPSLLQAVRCMSSSKLFVGGALSELFSPRNPLVVRYNCVLYGI
jgi:hypothetical protein